MRNLLIVFMWLLVGCTSVVEKEETSSKWEKAPIKNEFGEPIEGKFGFVGMFDGIMSNESTNGAPLKTILTIQDTVVNISLFEYGDYKVTFPELANMSIDVKTADGQTQSGNLFYFQGYIFESDGTSIILKTLETETEPVKVLIKRNVDRYLFEVDPLQFQNIKSS